jgi:hypothetical protein
MILTFHCNCGANNPKDAVYYDGTLGYEALICKKCGWYCDHTGAHPPTDESLKMAGITTLPDPLEGWVYDIYSPDGFSIHPIYTYPTAQAANEAFDKWKERFARQGYYSSNEGRISLDTLRDCCTFKQNKNGTKNIFVEG